MTIAVANAGLADNSGHFRNDMPGVAAGALVLNPAGGEDHQPRPD